MPRNPSTSFKPAFSLYESLQISMRRKHPFFPPWTVPCSPLPALPVTSACNQTGIPARLPACARASCKVHGCSTSRQPFLGGPFHGCCRQKELDLEAAEEEALAARVEAAVQERVLAAMASEETLARIAQRLTEERAKLEERVGPLALPCSLARRLIRRPTVRPRLCLAMPAALTGWLLQRVKPELGVWPHTGHYAITEPWPGTYLRWALLTVLPARCRTP